MGELSSLYILLNGEIFTILSSGGNVVGLGSSADYSKFQDPYANHYLLTASEDAAPLVEFSVQQGKPIIVVTIK